MKPAVTAQPEVTQFQLSSEDEFVILASDGLWDKLSNEDAVGLVMDTVKQPVMASQRYMLFSLQPHFAADRSWTQSSSLSWLLIDTHGVLDSHTLMQMDRAIQLYICLC